MKQDTTDLATVVAQYQKVIEILHSVIRNQHQTIMANISAFEWLAGKKPK